MTGPQLIASVPRTRPQVGQRLVDRPQVEGLGVEGPTDPLQHRVVFLVLGIADGLEELRVAPDAAAVLGRAGPPSGYAAGVGDPWLGWEHLLDDDAVFPAVTEVVLVEEHGAALW